ncbi:MAG: PD-(D/E)XK nuclease family protein [Syntrophobacterales bacterium]|nr:PD-(D/E)XK nuclease family protein [Syntrophobacterales bacterium]
MSQVFVVHPCLNLIEIVIEHMFERNHISSALVLFPHRRPILFFEYYMGKRIKKPCLLPQLRTLEEWIKETFVHSKDDPERVLSEYDQAWLAYLATRKVFSKEGRREPSWEEFLPWALRLVELFKEIDLELMEAKNLRYLPEESIPKRAVELLERVGTVYEEFNIGLRENGSITPSKILRYLAENNFPLPNCPTYLVGFYTLSRAENRLFRKLQENGAFVYWHADSNALPEPYRKWKEELGVELVDIRPETEHEPELFFFEAHDLHSELKELKERLSENPSDNRPDRRVVVLLSAGSLIPLIHHLPSCLANITLGYPLKLTGLFSFLQTLLSLVLEKSEGRGFRVQTLLEFLKNPYLEGTNTLEHIIEEYGAPFITEEKILELAGDSLVNWESISNELIKPLERVETPKELSQSILDIFRFLEPEKNFGDFEREFLIAIIEAILLVLRDSLFSEERMGKQGLFRLFGELISNVRVPFEGEPLVGLQIMGLLETRLLSFEEVFFLDINEGVLPDVEEVNPLVPQGIRRILGLPDRQRHETILWYHFERLVRNAKRVYLLWQFQTTESGEKGLEGKKTRSRYVERLMWEIEKRERKLFLQSKESYRLKRSSLELYPEVFSPPEFIKKTNWASERIEKKLKKISPSLLESYLECPLKFFYNHGLELSLPEDPIEVDLAQLGEATHRALEIFYGETGKLGEVISKEELSFERLLKLFEEEVEKRNFYRFLSPERRFFLQKGAEFRLRRFYENQPKNITIVSLEKEYSSRLRILDLEEVIITGVIDRVDRRNGYYIILDYKTGFIKPPKGKRFLELDPSSWLLEERYDDNTLREIIRYLGSLQLPLYVYLFYHNMCPDRGDLLKKTTAAYIELRKEGREIYLIKPDELKEIADDYANWFRNKFPELIKYLVLHIVKAPYWYPAIEDFTCSNCKFNRMCHYSR